MSNLAWAAHHREGPRDPSFDDVIVVRPGRAAGGQKQRTTIQMPNDRVSAVIGLKGARIKAIREASGAMVKLHDAPREDNTRYADLQGTYEQIKAALDMIQDAVRHSRLPKAPLPPTDDDEGAALAAEHNNFPASSTTILGSHAQQHPRKPPASSANSDDGDGGDPATAWAHEPPPRQQQPGGGRPEGATSATPPVDLWPHVTAAIRRERAERAALAAAKQPADLSFPPRPRPPSGADAPPRVPPGFTSLANGRSAAPPAAAAAATAGVSDTFSFHPRDAHAAAATAAPTPALVDHAEREQQLDHVLPIPRPAPLHTLGASTQPTSARPSLPLGHLFLPTPVAAAHSPIAAWAPPAPPTLTAEQLYQNHQMKEHAKRVDVPPAWMSLDIIPLPGQYIHHLHSPGPYRRSYTDNFRPARQAGQSSAADDEESELCVVCMENQRCVVLLPCAHIVLCNGCFKDIQAKGDAHCPMCRIVVSSHMLLE